MKTEITKPRGAVWVIAEQKAETLQSVSLQLLGKARILADQLGVAAEVVLLGEKLSGSAAELVAAGADTVYLAESSDLAVYQPESYAQVLVDLAREKQPDIVLMGSTCMGRELAPIVAARLATGLTAHCIDLVVGQDNVLQQHIPAYGGLISILCPTRRPQMATVAGGVFPSPVTDTKRQGSIEKIAFSPPSDLRVKVVELVKVESDEQSLDAADFIVAGGAGLGSLDGWDRLRELSLSLNAALGCTRPAVDEGWAELETMIGQSGRMVNPKFYLGAGLSGELQHMVGIKGAQLMIAINNDPKSPVFEQVDYGIVEDCSTFIPVLLDKLKERAKKQATS